MFKRKPKVIVLGIVGRSPAGLLETTDLELVRFFIEINKLELLLILYCPSKSN